MRSWVWQAKLLYRWPMKVYHKQATHCRALLVPHANVGYINTINLNALGINTEWEIEVYILYTHTCVCVCVCVCACVCVSAPGCVCVCEQPMYVQQTYVCTYLVNMAGWGIGEQDAHSAK